MGRLVLADIERATITSLVRALTQPVIHIIAHYWFRSVFSVILFP